jgi:hypothetical protein
MKHTTRTFLAIALLLLSGRHAAATNDHLQPNTSYVVEPDLYQRMLSQVFHPIYQERDLKLAVLITPSFKPEQVVGIRSRDGKNEVVVAAARQSIWGYVDVESYEAAQRDEPYSYLIEESDYKSQRAQLPGSYRDVPLDIASVPVDAELAKRISSVWKSALLSARQPVEPELGLDGTTFTFSMRVHGYGVLSGSTWSPDADTDMHSLVTLAKVMQQYATGNKAVTDVERAVGEYEKRLVNTQPAVDSEKSNGGKI